MKTHEEIEAKITSMIYQQLNLTISEDLETKLTHSYAYAVLVNFKKWLLGEEDVPSKPL